MIENPLQEYFAYNPNKDFGAFVTVPTLGWQDAGEKAALTNFQNAAENVPAYGDFLYRHGVKPGLVTTIEAFKDVPPVDKENYISQYDLKDLLLPDGSRTVVVHSSSGSSGRPRYWPKSLQQDLGTYRGVEMVWAMHFDSEKPTLHINSFALGPWTAGDSMQTATRMMAHKGYPITTISPGTNQDLLFDEFNNLAPHYEQVVIDGYPSFLRDVINEGHRRGVDFKGHNVKLLVGGEKFSENWTDFMNRHLDFSDDPFGSVASVLGLSEIGVASFSTKFTNHLRAYLHRNEKYARELFGSEELHTITQIIPPARYAEIVDGNLLLTASGAVPLIRYDTKDRGLLMTPAFINDLMPKDFHEEKNAHDYPNFNLPILTIDGRADQTIILFGANIYPEQLASFTEQPGIAEILSGRLRAEKVEVDDADVRLKIIYELQSGSQPDEELQLKIQQSAANYLATVNGEYKNVLNSSGSKAKPVVVLLPYGSEEFNLVSGKGMAIKN